MSTFSQRLTAFAAVIIALIAACILTSMWAFMSAFGEVLDDDETAGMVVEVACTDYAADVLDLRAQGYTAKQITQTLTVARGHEEEGSYLFEACGTPIEILTASGPVKK